jgi:hypothetical protein
MRPEVERSEKKSGKWETGNGIGKRETGNGKRERAISRRAGEWKIDK